MYGYPLTSVAAIENVSADIQEKSARIIYAAIRPFPRFTFLYGRRPSFIFNAFVAVIITVAAVIITVGAACWIFTHLVHLFRIGIVGRD
jgi:hypothetical protein